MNHQIYPFASTNVSSNTLITAHGWLLIFALALVAASACESVETEDVATDAAVRGSGSGTQIDSTMSCVSMDRRLTTDTTLTLRCDEGEIIESITLRHGGTCGKPGGCAVPAASVPSDLEQVCLGQPECQVDVSAMPFTCPSSTRTSLRGRDGRGGAAGQSRPSSTPVSSLAAWYQCSEATPQGDDDKNEDDDVDNGESADEGVDDPHPGVTVAVIKVSFQNFENSCSDDEVNGNLDIMHDVFHESSYGALSVDAEIVAHVKLDANGSTSCDTIRWAKMARALADEQVADLDSYDKFAYVFSEATGCGRNGSAGGDNVYLQDCAEAGTLLHEIGHTLGLGHAASVGVANWAIPHLMPSSDVWDYGDLTCIMGATQTVKGFNAPHRLQLNWLSPENIQEVTASGTYVIEQLQGASGGVKVLKIDNPYSAEDFYLSYRTAVGFDDTLLSTELNRVSIHSWPTPQGFSLLHKFAPWGDYGPDMRPVTDGQSVTVVPYNWDEDSDAASFPGFTVNQVDHDDATSTVEIHFL